MELAKRKAELEKEIDAAEKRWMELGEMRAKLRENALKLAGAVALINEQLQEQTAGDNPFEDKEQAA